MQTISNRGCISLAFLSNYLERLIWQLMSLNCVDILSIR